MKDNIKEDSEKEANKNKPKPVEKDHKVHVTVFYTQTADDKNFVAERGNTLQQTIDEAYRKLGETRRAGDQYFCHYEPRHDLTPYLGTTLEVMETQGICVRDNGRNRVEFGFDIEGDTGGAVGK
jgi:hypothetical protein